MERLKSHFKTFIAKHQKLVISQIVEIQLRKNANLHS